MFDDPSVRKRIPEKDAQITVQVADLPRSDGNIGVEETLRGLGFSTTEGKDPDYEPAPQTETEPSKSPSDGPPPGGLQKARRTRRIAPYVFLLLSCPCILI